MNFLELTAVLGLNKKDYDKGLDDASNKASSFGSKVGGVIGNAVKVVGAASVAAVGAAATGITALTTQAVNAYGTFEQLEGGVKKLFGDDVAKTVMDNADKAFATAGMSANQYMETVTSFSASLISGLKGDTKAAAEIADTAIKDMSDNANTFGTDIASIQAAYQGFAKQNYTMLDNLKLGFGGTKSEMLRLVQESGVLGEATKDLTLKNFDEKVSYDVIIQAIHKTQENMKIAGTTAKEADTTIQGTAGSLKSAWENLIIGLGKADADIGPLIDNVVQSALKMVNNIKPIATQAIKGISALIKGFAPVLAQELPPMIEELLPTLTDAIVMLINSVTKVLPNLISAILPPLLSALTGVVMSLLQALPSILQVLSSQLPVVLQQVIPAILTLLPLLIKTGLEFVMAIGKGLADNIDLLMDAVMAIIHYLVDELLTSDNIAQFIHVALEIILAIAEGIIKNLPEIIGAIAILVWNIIVGLGKALPDIGLQIIEFFVKLGDDIGNLIYEAFGDSILRFFDSIHEWFNTVGEVITLGCEKIVEFFVNFGTSIGSVVSKLWSNVTKFFTNGFNGIQTKVSDGLSGIKDKFFDIFENVKTTVSNAIEFLKGLFKFDWSLPQIKLPHFKVSGGEAPWGFAGQGSMPKVEVKWYRKAMDAPYLLDSATIFGAANGQYLGGGEAGTEMIYSHDRLMGDIGAAVRQALDNMIFEVPVYIGGKKIDQQIVTANARNAVVSGGR